MIQLANPTLPQSVIDTLAAYQQEIDLLEAYELRVQNVSRIWTSKLATAVFVEVKAILTDMCAGACRCCYCEDSMADEVEHIWPKSLFPWLTFDFNNYLYACGPCNGPKSNKFAIFVHSDRSFQHFQHPKNAPKVPPPAGDSVLLNPREEDPMKHLFLDLEKTFAFTPLDDDIASESNVRANYTIEVLRLNQRAKLIKSRRLAFDNYRARLTEYIYRKQSGAPMAKLETLIAGIRAEAHPTVWREMQRQHQAIPELALLFADAPEALGW